MTYNPGDFFLEDGKGLVSSIIRIGEKIYQHDSFCWATHAGLIVSSAGDTVEAEGNGVIRSSIETHIKSGMRFQVVDSGLDPRGRELAVEVAERECPAKSGSKGLDDEQLLSGRPRWRER